MNDELTELYRHIVQMIEDREGFTGNEKSLLELDMISVSEHIESLYDETRELLYEIDTLKKENREQLTEIQELIDENEAQHLEICNLKKLKEDLEYGKDKTD